MVWFLSARLVNNPCPARGNLLLLSQHSKYGTSAEGVVSMFAKAKSLKRHAGGPPGCAGSIAELDHGSGGGSNFGSNLDRPTGLLVSSSIYNLKFPTEDRRKW